MKECWKELKKFQKESSFLAEKQTIQRNSKEALTLKDRWVEYEWIQRVYSIVEDEGWARAISLKNRLQLPNAFFQFDINMMEQFMWLRDWVIFSLFLDMPPMRPQNGVLEILETVEYLGNRTSNGILVFEDAIYLQLAVYKNSRHIGEQVTQLSINFEKKIRMYLDIIRPQFVHRREKPNLATT